MWPSCRPVGGAASLGRQLAIAVRCAQNKGPPSTGLTGRCDCQIWSLTLSEPNQEPVSAPLDHGRDPAVPQDSLPRHSVQRIRREIRRRSLVVSRVEPLGSAMLRVWLEGEDLADFESGSPDDHIKLFFPVAGAGPDEKPAMRDYTPRLFDRAARTLAIDFALHDPAGPATAWARAARPGDVLNIGGPRGSAVVTDDFDWYLLVGDETAIPQFSRRIEELRPGVPVTALVSVAPGIQRAPVPAREGLTWIWVEHAGHGEDPAPLLAALGDAGLPEGEGYAWIAAEAAVAQAIRARLTDDMGHPLGWLRSSGYWTVGEAQG